MDAQGDPKVSNLILSIHHGKKLKVTILPNVVIWKVFGYINILRKCEQCGIYSNKHFELQFQALANSLTEKDSMQRKLYSEEASGI